MDLDQTETKRELTEKTEYAALTIFIPLAAGIWEIWFHHVSSGIEWMLWCSAPLAFILMFSWPARCRVIDWEDGYVCETIVGGFLFGCVDEAHKWDKFFARLGLNRGALGVLQRRYRQEQPTIAHHPSTEDDSSSEPLLVRIDDSPLSKLSCWVGIFSGLATVMQIIFKFPLT